MQKYNVTKIVASKRLKSGSMKFIAIDGHGSSGKSSLAKFLSKKLRAEIIRTDDFAGWDNPKGYADLVVNGTKPFEDQIA